MSKNFPPDQAREIPPEEISYEEAFNELELIVSILESGEHTLEKSLSLFDRGQALARRCIILLDQAELRVRQILGDELVDFHPPD